MARTPRQYVDDMVLAANEQDFYSQPAMIIAHYDQFTTALREGARSVGLKTESLGFKASVLLACDVLDHLAESLEQSEESEKEVGSAYIREAATRLRIATLWGESCHKETCLDLR